ncbi:hypothetical protein IAT38_001459 [Cryptococcus sp. DSM 104549]
MRLIKKRSSVSGTPTDSTPTSHNPFLISLPSSPPSTGPQPTLYRTPAPTAFRVDALSLRTVDLPPALTTVFTKEAPLRGEEGAGQVGRESIPTELVLSWPRLGVWYDEKLQGEEEGDEAGGRDDEPQVQDPPGPSRPVVASPPPTAPPAPASAPAPPPRVTPPRPLPTPPKPTPTVSVPPVTNPSPRRPLPHPPLSPSTGARFEGRSRKSGATGKARSQGDLRITTIPGVPSVLAVHTPASNTAPVAVGFPAPAIGSGDALVPPRPPFASTTSTSSALSTASGESSFSLIPTPRADDGQPHSRSVRNEPGAPKKLTKRRPVSMVGEGYGYNLVESPVDLADGVSLGGVSGGGRERIEMAREMATERAERHSRGHGHVMRGRSRPGPARHASRTGQRAARTGTGKGHLPFRRSGLSSVKTMAPMASLGDGQSVHPVLLSLPRLLRLPRPIKPRLPPLSRAHRRSRMPTNSPTRPPLNRLRSTSLASTSLGTNLVYRAGEVGTAAAGMIMTALAANMDVRGGIRAVAVLDAAGDHCSAVASAPAPVTAPAAAQAPPGAEEPADEQATAGFVPSLSGQR